SRLGAGSSSDFGALRLPAAMSSRSSSLSFGLAGLSGSLGAAAAGAAAGAAPAAGGPKPAAATLALAPPCLPPFAAAEACWGLAAPAFGASRGGSFSSLAGAGVVGGADGAAAVGAAAGAAAGAGATTVVAGGGTITTAGLVHSLNVTKPRTRIA